MKYYLGRVCQLIKGEEGASMVEYGLLIALVAGAAVLGLTSVGTSLGAMFTAIGTSITGKSTSTF
jgi:pilus assembly protein Flp/PilA